MQSKKSRGKKAPVKQSKVAQKKRAAILQAAVTLFSRHGFRRTSVDLLAEEAKVAKPTIYAHFQDKDALFAAVCELFMEQVLAGAARATSLSEPVERIASFLGAKFTFFFSLAGLSPHARELIDAKNALTSEAVEQAEKKYKAQLLEEVKRSAEKGEIDLEKLGLTATQLTDALMQAGYGAEYEARTVQEHTENLRRLVRLVLRL